jgi:hypothetical protein
MNAQSHLEQAHIPMSGIEEHITGATRPPQQAEPSNIAAWFATARLHGWPFVKHELQHNRRAQLASATSIVAVLVVAGFSLSMIGHHPSTPPRTYAIAQNETPLAPAATLARQAAPHRPTAADRPFKPATGSNSSGDDMAEFLRLGGEGQPDATPRPSPPATQAAAPAPPASTPVAAPMIHAASPVTDPATIAATLQAGPMSDRKQRDVLDLVTQLGTIIRDQRTEIAQLRSDEAKLQHQVDQEADDHGRRLSLIEARDAVQSAKTTTNSDTKPAPAMTAAAAASGRPVTVRVQTAATTPVTETSTSTPHRYHVQAASPGLAMLSELDASGGELRQIPVSPGDDLPGWGKVGSIAQHGTAWLVKTDHGLIQ